MKRKIFVLTLALVAGIFAGCSKTVNNSENCISIVYTNDIHSYIANSRKNPDSGEVVPALRISKVSQLVKDMKASGKNVLLVDAGDEIQGNTYGNIDKGASVVQIMNKAGYELATPGNHEFDYGAAHFFALSKKARFPYISCNFKGVAGNKKDPLKGSRILEAGGKKVAFVGITAPSTITSSTPKYFQDKNGNFIYEVIGSAGPEDLYSCVQKEIDSVRDKADFVVALGHVGVGLDAKRDRVSSEDIIANTTGLDAFIDAHSHTRIEGDFIQAKDGKKVLLTQTGAYLSAVGILTLGFDGSVSSELLSDYEKSDEEIVVLEEKLIQKIETRLAEEVAVLETELYICNPENQNQRLIRAQEMNAGDFVADSVYWYFNIARNLGCDICFVNGGGVRSVIRPGVVTEKNIREILPFGSSLCLIEATGQQIKDALEMGVTVIGQWDYEWDSPAENGGFLQVSGLRYKIDPKVKSNICKDENHMFVSVNGAYRINNVEVYNKEFGVYEPLDLNKTYRVGGLDYILRNGGNGLSMFMNCKGIADYIAQDTAVLSDYMKSFGNGKSGKNGKLPVVKTENSPLVIYKGLQLDYENAFGAGRIEVE